MLLVYMLVLQTIIGIPTTNELVTKLVVSPHALHHAEGQDGPSVTIVTVPYLSMSIDKICTK